MVQPGDLGVSVGEGCLAVGVEDVECLRVVASVAPVCHGQDVVAGCEGHLDCGGAEAVCAVADGGYEDEVGRLLVAVVGLVVVTVVVKETSGSGPGHPGFLHCVL